MILKCSSYKSIRADSIALSFLYTLVIIVIYYIMVLVVQKVDGAIHRINHCPANKHKQNQLSYLVDSSCMSSTLRTTGTTRSIVPSSTNNYYEPVSLSFCDLLKDAQGYSIKLSPFSFSLLTF